MLKQWLRKFRSKKWQALDERNGIFFEKKFNTPFTGLLIDQGKDGQVVKGGFVNGKKDGRWFYYCKKGAVPRQEIYKNGERDQRKALVNYHRINGRLSRIELPLVDDRVGDWWRVSDFHANGQPAMEGETNNSRREGIWASYGEDGGLISRGNYSQGLKHGVWDYYHTDGTKNEKLSGIYRQGELVSEQTN